MTNEYEFSFSCDYPVHDIGEEPVIADEHTIPLAAFAHASTIQAAARALVDSNGLSFRDAARALGRSPSNIWISYHHAPPLPPLPPDDLQVPVRVFRTHLSPLEALVSHLRSKGLRNIDIAHRLGLDPRTTWTAWKRAEVKR